MLGHVSFQMFLLGTGCLRSAGSGAFRFPASSLLRCHRTPSDSSVRLRSSLGFTYLGTDGGSVCHAALAATPAAPSSVLSGASESGHRFSADPDIATRKSEGLPGCLGVLFLRATVEHLAGPSSARRFAAEDAAFRRAETLNTGMCVFEAVWCGPHARLPTHQPPRYRDSCKARYRPAG